MDNKLEIIENYERLHIGVDEPFQFHCTMCGKCCINREDILLTPRDIYNMSKYLCINPADFFKKYCEAYIGSESRVPIIRLRPRGPIKRCPLLVNHKCSVHTAKPGVCATFPIGRYIIENKKNLQKSRDTEYIFVNPGCGDASETHTVREWLDTFGIPLEDSFFSDWTNIVIELGGYFHQAEKVFKPEQMDNIWNLTAFKLYLDYDINKEFIPQFQDAAETLLTLIKSIPLPKGGK